MQGVVEEGSLREGGVCARRTPHELHLYPRLAMKSQAAAG